MKKKKKKTRGTAKRGRAKNPVRRAPARRIARPASPPAVITPEFEVFALRAADIQAARRAAQKLRGEWRVRELSGALGEFQLVPTGQRLAPGSAWEQARQLARENGIIEAEPQFRYAGVEPDPDLLPALLAPHELTRGVRASGGGGGGLPCASDPQWSVKRVKADQVGPTNGSGIRVGHPDTGYSQHPEIWNPANNPVLPGLGFDFEDNKADPLDPLTGKNGGHGTSTASVIMSPLGGPNAQFVVGTAPAAHIVPLRVSDSVVHFSFSNVTQAIHRATDFAKVQVISMSLGGPFPSRSLERALLHARDSGVITFAAAGNVWPFVVYPARYGHVTAVAAVNCQDQRWRSSANGSAVDFSAPGESVWRARSEPGPVFTVDASSGTSYATATTAGICALWIEKHGHAALLAKYGARLSAAFQQIVTEQGCDVPANWDDRNMGAGIINAQKVLAAPLPAAVSAVRSRAPAGMLDSAAAYFPTLDPDQVMSAIGAGARRGGRQSVRAALDDLGDELLFQLGTNPHLRAQIHARATSGGRTSGGGRASVGRSAAVPIDASPAFRRAFSF